MSWSHRRGVVWGFVLSLRHVLSKSGFELVLLSFWFELFALLRVSL